MPKCTCARKTCSVHWSCWSPPGVPSASTGSPSRATSVGDSVVRGRFPGSSEFGSPSSSQNICARVPRQKPSSGMTGAPHSQPPLGVAETMFPQRSTTSRCTVSPRVGSPTPGAAATARDGRRQARVVAAGPQLGRRLVADEAPPLVGVRAREEHVHRHVDEVGVAVPRLAVGERELRALGDRVDVVGARVAHRREVEALEQAQLLEEHGRLAPRAGLEHGEAVVVDGERLLERRAPVAQVFLREQAAVPGTGAVHPLALLEVDDRLGDEAAVPRRVERVARAAASAAVRLRELRVAVQRPRLERRQKYTSADVVHSSRNSDSTFRIAPAICGSDGIAVLRVPDREAQ